MITIEAIVLSLLTTFVPEIHREVNEVITNIVKNSSTHIRDKKSTPITREGLIDTLRIGHIGVFAKQPSTKRLAGAWAQVAFENEQGRKIWNYNLGNIAQPPSSRNQNFYFHVGKTPYRSFDTHEQGAEAYWLVLKRCSRALAAFDYGDMATAAVSLKNCGYYATDIDTYSKNLKALFYTALTKLQ